MSMSPQDPSETDELLLARSRTDPEAFCLFYERPPAARFGMAHRSVSISRGSP